MKPNIQKMFDSIAHRYDFLNRFLSLGIDQKWRKRAIELLQAALLEQGMAHAVPSKKILDLCGGTGDFSEWVFKKMPGYKPVVLDFSFGMLKKARDKKASPYIIQGDALMLPSKDSAYSGVLNGFGMRNLYNLQKGLQEIYRVMEPGGVFVTLEFFKPARGVSRLFYEKLSPVMIPLTGKIISGDSMAYQYLIDSIKGFCLRTEYEEYARQAGFQVLRGEDLLGGIASIVVVRK